MHIGPLCLLVEYFYDAWFWTNSPDRARTPNSASAGARALFPCRWMCYNRPAVEHAVKPGPAPANLEPAPVPPDGAAVVPLQAAPPKQQHAAPQEDASRYCPVCSHRLESRRCKLICPVSGYYMTWAAPY